MMNPELTVFGLVIAPNEKWSTGAGFTIIGLLVRVFEAASSLTVIVREPAVFNTNPSKIRVPRSPLENMYLLEAVNGKVARESVDVKYTCPT